MTHKLATALNHPSNFKLSAGRNDMNNICVLFGGQEGSKEQKSQNLSPRQFAA